MTLVDTHCHLNFERYDDDREQVVARAAAAGVTRIIIPALNAQTCHEAIALAERYPGVLAAVGWHPNDTAQFAPDNLDILTLLKDHPKVVAVGEIGLDYYWDKSPAVQQIAAFEAQLTQAAAWQMPVIIHNRDASEDVLRVLEAWVPTLAPAMRLRPGVLHSFSAAPEIAERALAAGFYLGFTGPITFRKAEDVREIARMTPPERILVETDGPFLTPEPYRGRRNEPAYIPYIVERLAAVKGLEVAEMGQMTTANAERLFQLD